MNKKQRDAAAFVAWATEMQTMMMETDELYKVWFENGYNTGGSKAFTDSDLSSQAETEHMTAADLNALFNALEAIRNTYAANGNSGAIRRASYGGRLK